MTDIAQELPIEKLSISSNNSDKDNKSNDALSVAVSIV